MADKPASLLTKTQRKRLGEDFEGIGGAKRRRDQRQIRERLAAGLSDVSYFLDYPRDQIDTALSDDDSGEVARSVADLRLFAERVRQTRDIDESAVARAASERDTDVTLPEAPTSTKMGGNVSDRYTVWHRRAERLLLVGTGFLLLALAVTILAPDAASGPVGGIPAVIAIVTLPAGLLIVTVRCLKHDLVPVIRALAADPSAPLRRLWSDL